MIQKPQRNAVEGVQHSAPISIDSSSGPLIVFSGRVVGVNARILLGIGVNDVYFDSSTASVHRRFALLPSATQLSYSFSELVPSNVAVNDRQDDSRNGAWSQAERDRLSDLMATTMQQREAIIRQRIELIEKHERIAENLEKAPADRRQRLGLDVQQLEIAIESNDAEWLAVDALLSEMATHYDRITRQSGS